MTTKISSYVIQASLLNQIANIVPRITSIGYVSNLTATDTAGGQAVTVRGSGFQNGAVVYVDTTAAGSVTVSNSSFLTFTAPAKTSGSYVLYVTNPDGGSAIYVPGLQYSGTPTWMTPAGSQGNVYETVSYTNVFNASGDPLSYSLLSGSFPPAAVFNTATGILTGTAPIESGSTTYSFTIRALDIQNQYTDRSFSLTINTDVVTWNSPTAGNVYTIDQFTPISNVTVSATDAAGYAVSYTANTLPTGLTISNGLITGTPTVVANTSTLLTATAATTTRSNTRVISWVVRLAGDQYFPYVTLGLGANAAATMSANSFVTDASINNSQITVVGDTRAQNNNPYIEGYYSTYHATSADYISLPASSIFSIPTNTTPFTVEAWVYLTVSGVQHYLFGEQWTGSGTINMTVGFNAGPGQSLDTAGLYPVFGYYTGAAWNSTAQSGTAVAINTWYHVAYVFTGSTAYTFINGLNTTVSAATTWGGALSSNGDAWYIGRRWDTGAANGDTLRGYISNLRFVKGTALYTANFIPSTSSLTSITNTTILACQSNRFIDNSPNNVTLTKNGSVLLTSFNPFGNVSPTSVTVPISTSYSMYFDGTGDYLSIANNSVFDFGTGDFTVEFWIYTINWANTGGIIGKKTSDSTNGWQIYHNTSVANGKVTVRTQGGTDFSSTTSFSTYTWEHWALTRSGNTARWFRNGLLDNTNASFTSTIIDTAPTYIGYTQTWGGYYNGYISNLRVVKGSALYTTANFVPSTTSLTSVAPVGTVGYSTLFDGTGDYLSIPTSSAFGFGTGDFTVEAWFYGTVDNATDFMIDFRGGVAVAPAIFVYTSNQLALYYNGSVVYQPASLTFTFNTWNHVALVRSAGVSKFYLNGTGAATTYTDTNNYPAAPCVIGSDVLAGGTSYWTGYISNLRITKGQALYTTNFTPSTAPLTTTSQGAGAANVSLLTSQTAGFVDRSQYAQVIRNVGDATPSIFNPFYANANVYTSLLTCQNNTVVDNGILTAPIVVYGDARPYRNTPFVGALTTQTLTGYEGSAYFDGTGDYLAATIPAIGTNNFTIEFWAYRPVNQSEYIFVLGTTPNWGETTGVQIISYLGNYAVTVGGVNNNAITGMASYSAWHHFAVTRSGTAVKFFVDGVVLWSATDSTNLTGTALRLCNGVAGSWPNMIGYISNVRIVNGTALYTSAFFPSFAPATAITNTQLLTLQTRGVHNNSAFIDNSTLGNVITRAGNVTNGTFSPYGDNWSYYFNGSTDYLTVPNNTAFAFGSGSFTIETWIYNTTTASQQTIVERRGSGFATGDWVLFCNESAGNFSFYAYDINNASAILTATGGVANTWTHIAVVRNANTWTMYINGVSAATTTSSATIADNSQVVSVGKDLTAGIRFYFSGYISNLRITKGQALYTANFTPATSSLTTASQGATITNVSLLTAQDNRFRDSSVNNFTLTTAGTPSVQKFSPFSTLASLTRYYSGSFNGTSDYLTVGSSVSLALGAGSWTVELWMYPTSVAVAQNIIIDWRTSNNNQPVLYLANAQVIWRVNATSVIAAGAVVASTWTHLALVKNSGTTTLYLNGVSTATYADSVTYANDSVQIGKAWDANYWNGYLSNVRILKGVALYTGAFTPATAPLTLTQTAGTNVAAITGIPTNGNSVYFNGSSYLSIPATHALGFGTGDFTVEAWIYPTANPANGPGTIVEFRTGATATATNFRINSSFQMLVYNGPSNIETTFTTRVVGLNAWYHIAYVRSAGVAYGYINGLLAGSVAIAGDLGGSQPAFIGVNQAAGYNFNGYISNLRVVKGLAVYGGAFSPSTTPLTTTQAYSSNTATLSMQANGNSIYFNGSSSIIATPTTPVILGTSDFTIEFWAMATAAPTANWTTMFTMGFSGGGQEIRISQNINGTGYGFLYPNNSNNADTYAGYGTLPLYTWHHIALTRSGSSLFFLRNGAQIATATGISFNHTNTGTLRVGIPQAAYSTDGNFTGYISNFRITKGTALYNGPYTPSAGPLSVISGTGYLVGQGTTIVDATLNHVLTVSGAVVSPTQSPFGFTPALLTCQPVQTTVITDNSLAANPMTIVGTAQASRTQSPFGYSPSLLTLQSNVFIDNGLDYQTITAGSTTVKPLAVSPFAVPAPSPVPQTYSPLTNGGSMYFDGTGDYLTLPVNNPATIMGYSDFTVEAWIYPTTYSGTAQVIAAGQNDLASAAGSSWCLYIASATNSDSYSGGTTIGPASPNPVKNQWSHVAYVRSGTSLKTYLNGVQAGSASFASATTAVNNGATTYAPSIGAFANGGSAFAGYISDMRIVKGAALYTSGFFPPTAPATPAGTLPGSFTTYASTVFLNGATGGVIDATRTVDLETVGDARAVQFGPYNGLYYSNYFDGTSKIDTSASANLTLGTGDFTVEFWFNAASRYSLYAGLVGNFGSGGYAANTWVICDRHNNNPTVVSVYIYNVSSSVAAIVGTTTINNGTWYHCALTRVGNTFKLFINGILDATQTISVGMDAGSGTNFIDIGVNNTYNFQGSVSNLRIVKGQGLYTDAFTPATSPLTTGSVGTSGVSVAASITGTVSLLTAQSNKFIDNSAGALTLTPTGAPKVQTQNPFQINTGTSYYLDGTGDYLVSPSNALFGFGTGNFTIELWMYWIGGSGENTLLCVDVTSGLNLYLNITSAWGIGQRAVQVDNSFGTQPAKNVWVHIAVCRNASTVYAFINGTQAYSGANSVNYQTGQLAVGCIPTANTNIFNGYIADLRITRGLARYTAGFTPPTTPLLYK